MFLCSEFKRLGETNLMADHFSSNVVGIIVLIDHQVLYHFIAFGSKNVVYGKMCTSPCLCSRLDIFHVQFYVTRGSSGFSRPDFIFYSPSPSLFYVITYLNSFETRNNFSVQAFDISRRTMTYCKSHKCWKRDQLGVWFGFRTRILSYVCL
jgi:hypothetical protein